MIVNSAIHEAEVAYWKSVIEQCQSRPKGQTFKQWLLENKISKNQYYYWRNKLSKGVGSNYRVHSAPQYTRVAKRPTISLERFYNFYPDAVIRTDNKTIELSNSISNDLLEKLMRDIIRV